MTIRNSILIWYKISIFRRCKRFLVEDSQTICMRNFVFCLFEIETKWIISRSFWYYCMGIYALISYQMNVSRFGLKCCFLLRSHKKHFFNSKWQKIYLFLAKRWLEIIKDNGNAWIQKAIWNNQRSKMLIVLRKSSWNEVSSGGFSSCDRVKLETVFL